MDFFSIHSMVYFGFAQKKIHSIVYIIQKNPFYSLYRKLFEKTKIHISEFSIFSKSKMDFFYIQDIGYPDILIQNGHPYVFNR